MLEGSHSNFSISVVQCPGTLEKNTEKVVQGLGVSREKWTLFMMDLQFLSSYEKF